MGTDVRSSVTIERTVTDTDNVIPPIPSPHGSAHRDNKQCELFVRSHVTVPFGTTDSSHTTIYSIDLSHTTIYCQ